MRTLNLEQMEELKGGNAIGCAAGIIVVVGSLFGGFNPLGVIAGAAIIDNYC